MNQQTMALLQPDEQPVTFRVGDKVTVRNGQPRPPAHHKKKAREWEFRNYNGTVIEVDKRHPGHYTVRDDDHTMPGIIEMCSSGVPASRLTLVTGPEDAS